MFGSFLPSLRSLSNHSLLGSRSRHCYAIICQNSPCWACSIRNVLRSTSDFFDGKRLRAPRIHSRIQKLQPHLPFLLGARFADPDHPAALGAGHVFIEDKFDNLTAPEVETSAHPETFFRRIDDEAGESLCLAVQIDD